MQKQKENVFLDKFSLLNSQEHADEIIWSPSDSSEYEESAANAKINNITNKTRILKRKRKIKAPKNTCNLNITVTDSSKDIKEVYSVETSPILLSKKHQKSFYKSPILVPTLTCSHLFNSPVLSSRNSHQKSPILALKSDLPKSLGKVKKKLFAHQKCKNGPLHIEKNANSNDHINVKTEINSDYAIEADNLTCRSLFSEPSERSGKIVKSFFDSHFSSENSSQNSQSISDIQTQKNSTRTSEEIELLTSKTASNNNISIDIIKREISNHSSENSFYTFNKSKKIRYKKDGLAYRLDDLLRKQNASLSLWHHEAFLATNSNFVIPKGENCVFRIQKIHFKYGCFLLETVDFSEDVYIIIINSSYVSDKIISDTIIKVYEPFKVVQYNKDIKMLINVCRFECCHFRA